MREDIGLFRGKRIDSSAWVSGNLWRYGSDGKTYILHESGTPIEVDPATIGEYTGLKDKDGKRIFEDDVIEDDYGNRAKVIYGGWNCGCCYSVYGWMADGRCDLSPSCQTDVGNIHDNPELLEV